MKNPIAVCLDRNPFDSVDALVEAVRRVGFDRVEWFETGAAEVWTEGRTAAHIRALMRSHGLTAQYHAPYEAPFDLYRDGERCRSPREISDLLSQCMDRGARLDARLLTVHLGSCPGHANRAAALHAVADGFALALPEIERRGMRIAVENHTGAIINSPLGDKPEEFDWLMNALPAAAIGRTLDIGHAHINGHLEEFLSRPLDRVFNMHLHDNAGEQDEHLALGLGTIQWKETLARLSRERYEGVITFEFFAPPEEYERCIGMVRAQP